MTLGVVIGLLSAGCIIFLLAALGLVRLPDFYTRMQAASKATTLGIFWVMLAVALYFGTLGAALRAAAIVAFLFLTTPIGAHLLARAAYHRGQKPWVGARASEEEVREAPSPHGP